MGNQVLMKQWSTGSIRVKLIISVLIMTLPLIGMLIYNNFYSIHVVRGQVADSYKDTLSLYMNQIDKDLNDVDAYMNTVAFGNDLLSISQAKTDEAYYTAKVYLFNSLTNDVVLYRSLNSFFVYEKKRQDYMEVSARDDISHTEKQRVNQYIIDLIHDQGSRLVNLDKRWRYYQVGQDHYFIDIVRAGDAYLGAWIRADLLLEPLQSLKMVKEGEILFANDQGDPITKTTVVKNQHIELRKNLEEYYISGTKKKYLVVGEPSKRGNFSLISLIPDSHILSNLPYLQRIIWMITIGSILFIPIGLYEIRRVILLPLNRILSAMKKVRGGDWSAQVDMKKTSDEFALLGDSFNSMMREIQTLRVNVFEEQLNKQREELQRLQLQVNPHFFLNALNIVYNLAKVKNFQLILQMTEALIHYFRFMFRSVTSFVKLREELEHTRNYLDIQSLRFPGKLTWVIDAPDYLSETPVPPLIIQTFVENAIKHAFSMDDDPISIHVKMRFYDEEVGSRMKISVKDTGGGFDERVLQDLQAGRNIQNEAGEHIGIWNVQRRLKLLYGDQASVQYFNDKETGGAVVEIILPTNPEMEESHDLSHAPC